MLLSPCINPPHHLAGLGSLHAEHRAAPLDPDECDASDHLVPRRPGLPTYLDGLILQEFPVAALCNLITIMPPDTLALLCAPAARARAPGRLRQCATCCRRGQLQDLSLEAKSNAARLAATPLPTLLCRAARSMGADGFVGQECVWTIAVGPISKNSK
ncbi:hypothetical protein ACP70R_002706 [Stipagrostis hirtigluma subsp. patula]